MTINTIDSMEITQLIKIQEQKMEELLSNVMGAPLNPLKDRIKQIEICLKSVEAIGKENSDNLNCVISIIQDQGECNRKNLKKLENSIIEEFPKMLTESLASMPQEITQLVQNQIALRNLLSEVKQEQTLQAKQVGDTFIQSEKLLMKSFSQMNEINSLAKAAVQVFEKAVTKIDKNREYIGKNIHNMQVAGRLQTQQLSNKMIALAGYFSAISQDIDRLLDGQNLQVNLVGKSINQINEIKNVAEEAVQVSKKTVTQIDKNREHIEKNLDSMHADGRLAIQQLSNEMTTLAGSLSRTSAQVTELAPTLAGTTDELGSRLESGFISLRKQSEKDCNALSNALQIIEKRFLWLSVLCGLSFAGSVGLVISRFVLHV